jgi:asparagine synthase (glutamine-hydrolysing)
MVHGGPDAALCYAEFEKYKFGHNRLSILGLDSRNNQPYYSSDRRYLIIYNGEVYNYKELARDYSIDLTANDTELILKLSLKIGFKNALEKFNGMFAYVIFDTQTKEFFVARDRLGVKPLYYYKKDDEYIFSSEINAIVSLLENVKYDEIGLRQYKKLRAFFNGHTIYKNIQMFPAGCFIQNAKIHKYWELSLDKQNPPSDEELKYLIESSVQYRKIADVPIGSYLSGGLDSTIIAALVKELHTWTIGFESDNEFKYGELAAKRIKSCHHEILINDEQFISTAKKIISIRKEPLSVPNEVLLYYMTLKVREKNTVVLCGEGADELFFGYDRIFRWANSLKVFDIEEFSRYYSYGSNDDLEIVESVVDPFKKYGRPIDITASFFQIAHLHSLLRRLDNSTMMCGVEARSPFLDYRLIERMAGVPFHFRMENGIVKAPLKRIFADILPVEIIEREKVGFPVELTRIFNVKKHISFDNWVEFNINELENNIS